MVPALSSSRSPDARTTARVAEKAQDYSRDLSKPATPAYPAWWFLFSNVTPFLVVIGPLLPRPMYGLAAMFVYVVIPMLDYAWAKATGYQANATVPNSMQKMRHTLNGGTDFRAMLWINVMFSLAAQFIVLALVPTEKGPRTVAESIELTVSLSVIGVSLYGGGHELMHRYSPKSALDRWLGSAVVMSTLLNPVYAANHFHHHRFVGTDKDPSSAPRGMTVYEFIRRSEIEGLKIATSNCRGLLKAWLKGSISFKEVSSSLTHRDWVLARGIICTSVLCAIAYVCGGAGAVRFYCGAGVIGAISIDAVNYVQHYGLRRNLKPDTGLPEALPPSHSWDAPHLFSNIATFASGLHASHHEDSRLEYPFLYQKGPCYPYGLVPIIFAAFAPSFFFSIADPILDDLEKRVS